MAIINKTGITDGGTIQAAHVTRAINALSGGSTDTIIATGSFSGSLTGTLNGSASFATSASAISITNTTTGTGPYYVTFVDGVTGVRTLRADNATNALAFNATTNTLTTTSSYAVTASYALNGGGAVAQSTTLTFFHSEVTGTASGSKVYIGGFASDPISNANRVGLVVPYNGKVKHTWVSTYAPIQDSCLLDVYLMQNGVLVASIAKDLSLSGFTDYGYTTDVEYSVSEGDLLNIRINQTADSSAKWNVNVGIVIERV